MASDEQITYTIVINEVQRKMIEDGLFAYLLHYGEELKKKPVPEGSAWGIIAPEENMFLEMQVLHGMVKDLYGVDQNCEPIQTIQHKVLNGFTL